MSKKALGIDVSGKKIICMSVSENGDVGFIISEEVKAEHTSDSAIKQVARVIGDALSRDDFDFITMKKAADKGKFMAGPLTYKTQGLVHHMAVMEGIPMYFIPPQTIAAVQKKMSYSIPKMHKYQQTAYQAAYTALNK